MKKVTAILLFLSILFTVPFGVVNANTKANAGVSDEIQYAKDCKLSQDMGEANANANANTKANAEVSDEIQYAKDGKLLQDIGVVSEVATAGFHEEISRGEFVSMLSAIVNLDQNIQLNTHPYADVVGTDYETVISILYASGAISSGENFYPERPITSAEAIKILVELLGYGYRANESGGYPAGYFKTAAELNILPAIQIGTNLTKGEAYSLYKAALFTDVARVKTVGATVQYEIKEGVTLLNERLNIVRKTGKVTVNSQTGLSYYMLPRDGYIGIDNKMYEYDKNFDKHNFDEYNFDKYIGMKVEYFYRSKNGEDENIIFMQPTGKNSIKEFATKDIATFSNMTYSVQEGEVIEKYKLEKDIDVLYNMKAYPEYKEADLKPLVGSVKLIDSNGDGEYETVAITSVLDYIVSNIASDGTIYDELGKPPIHTQDVGITTIIKLENVAVDFTEIKSGDLLSIIISKNTVGKKLIQVDIIRKNIVGEVQEILDERTIKVGGKDYTLTEQLISDIKNNVKIGLKLELKKMVKLYLNTFDEVAYFEADSSEDKSYGYVRNAVLEGGVTEITKLRILGSDGEWKTLKCAEKINLDGDNNKKGNDVIKALTGTNGKIKAQPIRYKINASGVINMIDTQAVGPNEIANDTLSQSNLNPTNEKWTYKRASRTFEGYFALANVCTVFSVAGEGFEDDETLYQVGNAGYFTEGGKYAVKAYNLSEAMVSDLVVVQGSGIGMDIDAEEKLILVEKITKTVNKAGEEVSRIVGMQDGKAFQMMTKDADVTLIDRTNNDKKSSCDILKCGDVIRVQKDLNSMIIGAERLVDMEKFKANKLTGVASKFSGGAMGYRDGYSLRGGFVYATSDDIMAITNMPDIEVSDVDTPKNLVTFSSKAPTITVYNMETEKATAGAMENIISYKSLNSSQNTSFVYLRAVNGDPKDMIIFVR